MDWKLLVIFIISIAIHNVCTHPGIRTPPTELLEKFMNESEISPITANSTSTTATTTTTSPAAVTATTTTTTTTIKPLLNDGRDFPKSHSSFNTNASQTNKRNSTRSAQSANKLDTLLSSSSSSPKPHRLSSRYESDTYHQGVAVPLTQEELEKEMSAAAVSSFPSSTSREGLSTWILLSGTATTPQPSKRPMLSPAMTSAIASPLSLMAANQRKDDKIAKIEKIEPITPRPMPSSTPKTPNKSKPKPQPAKNAKKPNEVQRVENVNLVRKKKPVQENRPNLQNKQTALQAKKKLTTTTTPKTKTTTTTTPVPEEELATSSEMSVSSTTAETTTFLILEPKDADFDMPQDRSPGSTTKKPKRKNSNKKNKKKNTGLNSKTDIAEKKPLNSNKDKPLTTKIYNYLAREIMPTVGVGLVGLALTAGLATYFLGTPFGALRRSYDIADRKDDTFYYNNNNEEYAAGTDGQSEEEVFGKVIAGMPVNSPYRNSIQYSIYRPAPNQYQPKYARQPQQYQSQQAQQNIRYRTNDQSYYNQPQQHIQQQIQQQIQQPLQQSIYTNPKPYESSSSQQYFRYNANDANAYRTNSQSVPETQKTFSSSYSMSVADNDMSISNDPSVKIKIVTPATTTTEVEPITDPSVSILDNDVLLQRRSQFVVGSSGSVSTENPSPNELPNLETIPEHGPRRRRRRDAPFKIDLSSKINENENEVDGAVPKDPHPEIIKKEAWKPVVEITSASNKIEKKPEATFPTTTTTTTSTIYPSLDSVEDMDSATDDWLMETSSTENPNKQPPLAQTIFNLVRSIFELKVRTGLSFLQNTTETFGKYLKNVEKRIEESKVFTRHRRPSLF